MSLEYIVPDWPAPKNVNCVTTTRVGGVSQNEYQSFNLGGYVKDDKSNIDQNRLLLKTDLKLPNDPVWLNQVHDSTVLKLDNPMPENNTADAAYTEEEGVVCVVLTADCLPVVFSDQKGKHIAVAHGGWRGLVKGVLENTLEVLPVVNSEIICWLGPAIGPNKFEVGKEVFEQFVDKNVVHKNAFHIQKNGKYLANIFQLARNILAKENVTQIYGGMHCTYTDRKNFYSYRRDGETGRMATLIWRA